MAMPVPDGLRSEWTPFATQEMITILEKSGGIWINRHPPACNIVHQSRRPTPPGTGLLLYVALIRRVVGMRGLKSFFDSKTGGQKQLQLYLVPRL